MPDLKVLNKKMITMFMIFLTTVFSGSAFSLESFSKKDAVLNFEIEGVSVLTPVKEIADLLTNRGWILVDSPSSGMLNNVMLTFVKDVADLKVFRNMHKSKAGGTG